MFYDPKNTTYFKSTLTTIVGQALDAAGYVMENHPLQQARGLIRFRKKLTSLGSDIYGFVEWQLLAFEQSPVARFQINLLRNKGLDARAITDYAKREEHTLPWVIWNVYEVKVVPHDKVWWDFRDTIELEQALASAGRLLFGYGVPWLELSEF